MLPLLHRAVRESDARRVRRRLAAGDDVNRVNGGKGRISFTPLSLAVHKQDRAIIKILLESGADVSAVSEGGDPVLLTAIATGDIEICKLLVHAGAHLDCVNKEGFGAVRVASLMNDVRMVEFLMSLGAAVDMTDEFGVTALLSVSRQGSFACCKALLKVKA